MATRVMRPKCDPRPEPYGVSRQPQERNILGIEGRVVVITGASSGIGEATALLLAARRMKVVLGARRLDRLQTVVARIVDAGGEAAYVRTDVKRREDLANLIKLACDRFGKLDVLVNNAGRGGCE